MSKELFPLGFCILPDRDGPRPRVAAQYLLSSMRAAGAEQTFIIMRRGKWDIPAYLGDGTSVGIRLAYLMLDRTPGVPFTVDAAYPFCRAKRVLFGFPDIIHQPEDALLRMVEEQERSGAAIVLGLFPVHRCEKMDMVGLDGRGRVREVVIKPRETGLRYTWILAVWTPPFSEFLHAFVGKHGEARGSEGAKGTGRELFMGHVLQEALDAGMHIESVVFDRGEYLDIGTPADLMEAVRRTAQQCRESA